MKIAVVTGASSGLGREFVREINRKYRTIDEIWIIARRADRLRELQKEIKEKKIRVLPYDITDESAMDSYKGLLDELNPTIRVLVNCAGFGKFGLFDEIPIEDQVGMIDLNCKALTVFTYHSLPYMASPSNIIQVASSAGFMPQPRLSIYAASKAFVLNFSRALNVELAEQNITVTAVCPGPVKTEFFDIAEETGHSKAVSMLAMATADKVAKKAIKDAAKGREISVYGTMIKGFRALSNIIPNKIIMKMVIRM